MLPQHLPKSIHHLLQLIQPQLALPSPAFLEIVPQLLQSLVDLLVLRQQLQLLAERRHLARQHGEDVRLLDAVVRLQMRAEV